MCGGQTQHVEVYDLSYEGNEKTYEDLIKHFFMFHDPTTLNQQGNDRGTQYASAIFCYDDKQVSQRATNGYCAFCKNAIAICVNNITHSPHLYTFIY